MIIRLKHIVNTTLLINCKLWVVFANIVDIFQHEYYNHYCDKVLSQTLLEVISDYIWLTNRLKDPAAWLIIGRLSRDLPRCFSKLRSIG